MKKNIFLIAVLGILSTCSFSQPFQIVYGGSNSDWGNSIVQANDSEYIVAGYTASFGLGGFDGCLLKINNKGDTLWVKTYGSTEQFIGLDFSETFVKIIKTRDEGY